MINKVAAKEDVILGIEIIKMSLKLEIKFIYEQTVYRIHSLIRILFIKVIS